MKRKRNSAVTSAATAPPAKRRKTRSAASASLPRCPAATTPHPVLVCYYERVVTLRDYLSVRLREDANGDGHGNGDGDGDDDCCRALDALPRDSQAPGADGLSAILDGVLVGCNGAGRVKDPRGRARDLLLFSQLSPDSIINKPCRTPDWAVLQREV
jgi:hypothetical protein